MPVLEEVLGYDLAAEQIALALQESNDIVVLEGPPGVGKSWLATGIGSLWDAGGGSTVVAEGDSSSSDVGFTAFGWTMTWLPPNWGARLSAASGIARAGEYLLGTAGIITSTVEMLAKIRRARREEKRAFLGELEQKVLSHLEYLGRKKPLLLIADNLHWWDKKSLGFLARLRQPRVAASFPFLTEMRVLAVRTTEPYQRTAHPEAQAALLRPTLSRVVTLGRVPREDFGEVLVALGAPSEAAECVADVAYSFSGGHLALAARCATRLAHGDIERFLNVETKDEFLRALLRERIDALGAEGRAVVALLQVAAVLGLNFHRDELSCAHEGKDTDVGRLLRYCRDEEVVRLEEDSDSGFFVHDLFREYFLTAGSQDAVAIHERIGECLRILRPAKYDLRCDNALKAERPREAATFAVQAALAEERDGRSWEVLPNALRESIVARGWRPMLEKMIQALRHLHRYEAGPCLACLEKFPRELPQPLLAEIDYLRCMCLMTTRSEEDRRLAISTLKAWEGYEGKESELGVRLLRLLLYCLSLDFDKEPGRLLERRIRQHLRDRLEYRDSDAEDALHVLDRSACGLYLPDVTLIRISEAVEYFAPSEGQTLPPHPVEYYRCLVNQGANFIGNARYEEARAVYLDLEEFVAEYSSGVFPRLDLPRMNAVLADYRLGLIGAPKAARRQRLIANKEKVVDDPFYVENGLAVYLALAGITDKALDIYGRLHVALAQRRRPEPSMRYLIGANRACVRYLMGDVETARREWDDLVEVVERIEYVIQPMLLRRHDLLRGVLAEEPTMTPAAFDDCILVRAPDEFGPLWHNIGRGFRLPEVEFWS